MSDNTTTAAPEKPDKFAMARRDLLDRLIDPIAEAICDKRPWEGVVYPLGEIVDHPLSPGKKGFLPDGSFLFSIPVALRHRPIPERNKICCAWKRPGPPLHVFFDLAGAKRLIDLLDEVLKEADDTDRPWRASVRTMGALEQPDPRFYGKTCLAHDGSFITLILVGNPKEWLPRPGDFQVWWQGEQKADPSE